MGMLGSSRLTFCLTVDMISCGSTLVRSQLYGLTPYDPGTLVTATVVLAAVACLAGFIPALRASRIDPTHALRYE